MKEDEERELRSAALQNAQSIFLARRRAEEELVRAKEALEEKGRELARSLSVMRAIIDQSPVGMFLLDAHLRVQHVNPKASPVFGDIAPLEGRDFSEIMHIIWPEKVASELMHHYRHTLETGEPFFSHDFGEVRRGRDTKEYYDWELHRITLPDAQQGVVCYFMDMSAHVLAQQALQRSEGDLRTLADSIPQLAWMAGPDGKIFWYNKGWYEYTGTTFAEMMDRGWETLHDPKFLPLVLERWTASIQSGVPFDMEFPLRGADGDFRWFLTRINPVHDAQGKVLRWFGTNTDVDEVKRVERALQQELKERVRAEADRERLLVSEKEARERAERETRMKDEFLATLSHELRTPLNSILGWSTLLGASDKREEIAEGLAVIERNARAQTQIIEDLLDMSRIVSGNVRLDVQRVDLVAVIKSAIESVSPMAAAREIRLTSVLDPFAGHVSGDPARLQQVLWNLVTNALKFTPKGGRVQVVLERVNSHLEISVTDSGQGITPDFLPHVFDRFRQADSTTTRHHGGLGLGLAIVKNLVELHGGSVRAKSPGTGQGATFTICLPVVVATMDLTPDGRHPRAADAGGSIQENPGLGGLRVLAVDDEADARELINRILTRCGAMVETARSGTDALQALRDNKPDVLIMDIGMPDEDGYSVIRKVRKLAPEQGGDVPAIALTAFARSEDRRKAILSGFQMHMSKPVEPSELIAMVASLASRI